MAPNNNGGVTMPESKSKKTNVSDVISYMQKNLQKLNVLDLGSPIAEHNEPPMVMLDDKTRKYFYLPTSDHQMLIALVTVGIEGKGPMRFDPAPLLVDISPGMTPDLEISGFVVLKREGPLCKTDGATLAKLEGDLYKLKDKFFEDKPESTQKNWKIPPRPKTGQYADHEMFCLTFPKKNAEQANEFSSLLKQHGFLSKIALTKRSENPCVVVDVTATLYNELKP